ncbi:FAD-binding oxidoreductase [Undibacterium sp. Ji50W]|uniref:FAD-binding oxidoreductase n=1 Tax=Undibacterium sp. Ji50W TaxID=3413041 RepID=UPI003BF2EBB0
MITIRDLTGLNQTEISSMPLITDQVPVQTHVQNLAAGEKLSVAGSRHSQGGQATCTGHVMLVSELMDKIIAVNVNDNTITVEAGATWSRVHHQLNKFALAPLVHQSSPGFSVGGSLSVNCHGRDPRMGPLSSTVKSLKLLLPDGSIQSNVTPDSDLAKAVLGGYGSCAIILEASLQVCPNEMLEQESELMSLAEYQTFIDSKGSGSDPWPDMHYAWLSFDPDKLYENVLRVSYKNKQKLAWKDEKLDIEQWVTGEFTRGVWSKAREDKVARSKLWKGIVSYYTNSNPIKSRMNWMRSSISFVMHKGEKETDLLQEYFVPVANLQSFVEKLKTIIYPGDGSVRVMSTTVRIVQAEKNGETTFLSYCPTQTMACIAVDLNVDIENGKPKPSVIGCFNKAIQLAMAEGGTYYLPYYRAADKALFQKAYPGYINQQKIITSTNPHRKFDNDFLNSYF